MSIKARAPSSTLPGSFNGTLYGQSTYGDTCPELCGRGRIPPKMVWAANHRQFKSGKKLKQSKKKGSQPSYAQNCDFLLAGTTLQDLLTVWRNKDIFAVTKTSESGVIASNSYTLSSTPGGNTVVAILAVLLDVTYSEIFRDFGGPNPATFTGSSQLPLYRKESMKAPVFDVSLTSQFPYPYVYSVAGFTPSQFPTITFDPGTFSSLNGQTV